MYQNVDWEKSYEPLLIEGSEFSCIKQVSIAIVIVYGKTRYNKETNHYR